MSEDLPSLFNRLNTQPAAYYRELRRLSADGCFWDPVLQGWLICGYADCIRILSASALTSKSRIAFDAQSFGSEHGRLVSRALTIMSQQMFFDDSARSRLSQEAWRRRIAPGSDAVASAEIHALADAVVGRLPLVGDFDLNEHLRDYASRCIFRRLNFLDAEQARWRRCAEDYAAFLDGKIESLEQLIESLSSLVRLADYVSDRDRDPTWPVVEDDLTRMTSDVVAVLTGGHESIAFLLGTVLRTCGPLGPDWPDDRLLLAWLHEGLRLDPPIQMLGRITQRVLTIGSHTLPIGSKVYLHLGAAHHDASVFEQPEQFQAGRRPPPHFAFGTGPGRCIGMSLAVSAAWAFLRALSRRRISLTVATDGVEWRNGLSGRSYGQLPCTLSSTRT